MIGRTDAAVFRLPKKQRISVGFFDGQAHNQTRILRARGRALYYVVPVSM